MLRYQGTEESSSQGPNGVRSSQDEAWCETVRNRHADFHTWKALSDGRPCTGHSDRRSRHGSGCPLLAVSVINRPSPGCFHDCTVSAIVVIVIRFHHLVDGILVISYVGISTIFTGLFFVATSIDKLPRPGVVFFESTETETARLFSSNDL